MRQDSTSHTETTAGVQIKSFAEAEVVVDLLSRRLVELERVLMIHDEELDTGFRTPFLKRVVFWLDGWPLRRICNAPAWRPWRRWWTS